MFRASTLVQLFGGPVLAVVVFRVRFPGVDGEEEDVGIPRVYQLPLTVSVARPSAARDRGRGMLGRLPWMVSFSGS